MVVGITHHLRTAKPIRLTFFGDDPISPNKICKERNIANVAGKYWN